MFVSEWVYESVKMAVPRGPIFSPSAAMASVSSDAVEVAGVDTDGEFAPDDAEEDVVTDGSSIRSDIVRRKGRWNSVSVITESEAAVGGGGMESKERTL